MCVFRKALKIFGKGTMNIVNKIELIDEKRVKTVEFNLNGPMEINKHAVTIILDSVT